MADDDLSFYVRKSFNEGYQKGLTEGRLEAQKSASDAAKAGLALAETLDEALSLGGYDAETLIEKSAKCLRNLVCCLTCGLPCDGCSP